MGTLPGIGVNCSLIIIPTLKYFFFTIVPQHDVSDPATSKAGARRQLEQYSRPTFLITSIVLHTEFMNVRKAKNKKVYGILRVFNKDYQMTKNDKKNPLKKEEDLYRIFWNRIVWN
jgi:hypothetical protein